MCSRNTRQRSTISLIRTLFPTRSRHRGKRFEKLLPSWLRQSQAIFRDFLTLDTNMLRVRSRSWRTRSMLSSSKWAMEPQCESLRGSTESVKLSGWAIWTTLTEKRYFICRLNCDTRYPAIVTASPVFHAYIWEVPCGSVGRNCRDLNSTVFRSRGFATLSLSTCLILVFDPIPLVDYAGQNQGSLMMQQLRVTSSVGHWLRHARCGCSTLVRRSSLNISFRNCYCNISGTR